MLHSGHLLSPAVEPLEHAVPVEEVAAFQSQPAVIEEHCIDARHGHLECGEHVEQRCRAAVGGAGLAVRVLSLLGGPGVRRRSRRRASSGSRGAGGSHVFCRAAMCSQAAKRRAGAAAGAGDSRTLAHASRWKSMTFCCGKGNRPARTTLILRSPPPRRKDGRRAALGLLRLLSRACPRSWSTRRRAPRRAQTRRRRRL